jgi:endonuclease/exonuclease/phosphatase (EEP) superfamily protein YafD
MPLSPVRMTVAVVAGTIGALATLATLLGFLGSWYWRFDILASFRAQLLVILVLCGVTYLWLVGRILGTVFLAAAAINLLLVAPLFFGAAGDPVPGGAGLKIVAFNQQVSNPGVEEIAAYLAQSDADVIFLMESSFEWEDDLLALDLPYELVAEVPADRRFGISMFSRLPAETAVIRLGPTKDPAVSATVEIDGEPVDLLAIHPVSPTTGQRSSHRDETLSEAGLWAAGRPGSAVVVGDFNASTWSHALRSMQERADLRNSLVGKGLQPSWRTGWGPFMVTIDHAVHTKDLVTIARATGPSLGSDHRPIEVTLARSAD